MNQDDSITARIALNGYGDWPNSMVETAIRSCNDAGQLTVGLLWGEE